MNSKFVLVLFISMLLLPVIVIGATDGTYNITVDNVGFSGGEESADGIYNLFDTIGTPLVGLGSSTNYKAQDGFWYMVNNTISLVLDSNVKDLGTVISGSPNTATTTITVTTDAWGGYELLISKNHNLIHNIDNNTIISDYSATITSPTAWTGTGFGFTVTNGTGVEAKWGTTPNNNYASIPITDTVFHDKTGFTSGGDETIVEYKIDVPSTQKSGTYSNTVTYTAISKL